ncbi:MAG: hypothetical protein HC837_12310 [Chloroflexaceae bacterium]|nr:hypothetical protein [Chloroflexaceae bacterium]
MGDTGSAGWWYNRGIGHSVQSSLYQQVEQAVAMASSIFEQHEEITYTARQARQLILRGKAFAGMRVRGQLDLSDCTGKPGSEPPLQLPEQLIATSVNLAGCTALQALPEGWQCYDLDLSQTLIRSLPASLHVDFRLNLTGCTRLTHLPDGLKVGSLIVRGCTALEILPERLDVYFLDIAQCVNLIDWPNEASVRIGRLDASGCPQIRTLPPWLKRLSQINVSDCVSLMQLPDHLQITSWIDLANTRLTSLPAASSGVQIRWRGVPIDERIAFRPETITAAEVLNETRIERRRVLLERLGYARFLDQVQATILDEDEQSGNERRLLRVPMINDEDLVCLTMYTPATERQSVVRVPPTIQTCQHAAAWIAGYDNPDEYQPLMET